MDSCNAFKLFVLYAGFLICAPGIIKKKLVYTLIGLPLIFVLNIARCYAVAILVLRKPEWIYIAHHYIFTIVVYSAIFLLWLSFLKEKKEV
jgi:exosortase/archaeosortase family protein